MSGDVTGGAWYAGNEFVPSKWQFSTLIAISAEGEVVAHVNCGFGHGHANAALISAAPDLLAALKALHARYNDRKGIPATLDAQVRAAIGKAEGQKRPKRVDK